MPQKVVRLITIHNYMHKNKQQELNKRCAKHIGCSCATLDCSCAAPACSCAALASVSILRTYGRVK